MQYMYCVVLCSVCVCALFSYFCLTGVFFLHVYFDLCFLIFVLLLRGRERKRECEVGLVSLWGVPGGWKICDQNILSVKN